MSIELKLSRSNRVYRPSVSPFAPLPFSEFLNIFGVDHDDFDFGFQEPLEGKIIVKSPSLISHYGIRLTLNGSVNLQVRGGSAGVIESFYGVIKPIPIVNKNVEVKPSGKIGSDLLHSLPLLSSRPNSGLRLSSSVSVPPLRLSSPHISASPPWISASPLGFLRLSSSDLRLSSLDGLLCFMFDIPFSLYLKKPGEENLEKFYETFHGANISIQDTQRHPILPELKSGGLRVTGRMSTQCSLSDAITGELTIEGSAVPISSIDVHLLRIESILLGERIVTETSLIQTTQIADGDVCRNLTLPIYVILPRLLTCPTVMAGPFSIEFKVLLVISFQSELSKLHSKSDPRTPRLWVSMLLNLLRLRDIVVF
ncbi:Down syndrome critical region protein 3-like protein [Morus notabilis]|uniref:Down syndrome critical region protein 3-like protein n=1 Tax=Morus notabilis TaxID=981085 RepID=W9RAQ6_9ROSA|nr:Down syndrome critical region protein 3-like protein [Morus notabilis]